MRLLITCTGLELSLGVKEGKLALNFISGEGKFAKDGLKLFSQAMENSSFRANLVSQLKSAEETLTSSLNVFKEGSRNAEFAQKTPGEVKDVLKVITK